MGLCVFPPPVHVCYDLRGRPNSWLRSPQPVLRWDAASSGHDEHVLRGTLDAAPSDGCTIDYRHTTKRTSTTSPPPTSFHLLVTRGDCPMRRGTSMCSGPGPRQSPLISSEPTSSWKRRTGRVWAHEHLARGEAANRAVAPGGFQAQPKIERLTIC